MKPGKTFPFYSGSESNFYFDLHLFLVKGERNKKGHFKVVIRISENMMSHSKCSAVFVINVF